MFTGTAYRQPTARQATIADLCRQLVIETYAPAAVLINRDLECLYFLGPTDCYLHVALGHPTHDLLAMVRPEMTIELRSAILQATQQNVRVVVDCECLITDKSRQRPFSIAVQPASIDGEELLLVCFIEKAQEVGRPVNMAGLKDTPYHPKLDSGPEATRPALQHATRTGTLCGDERTTIDREVLSATKELTSLNSQLQETILRQRTKSNDLQNLLCSTGVATLYLDRDLNIRFFTPGMKSLFDVIDADVGRSICDLRSLTFDDSLRQDARKVLTTLEPIERELEAKTGLWYIRTILPYRAADHDIAGLVITYGDITERKHSLDELQVAKRWAETANVAKSLVLAAARHDLRQPIQTLQLLQGLLAGVVEGEKAPKLIARMDKTLGILSEMLNTLLDINQIDAGTVRTASATFPLNDLLTRLRDEFSSRAVAKGLALRIVPCGLSVHSDPRILEQMLRNLLSNALKFTRQGKILIGCRRRLGMLNIQVHDTGAGIPEGELEAIFDEHYNLGNAPRERSRDLGLALPTVKGLASLLAHRVEVRSFVGRGSCFAISIQHSQIVEMRPKGSPQAVIDDRGVPRNERPGTILAIEDDTEARELVTLFLKEDGHRVTSARDGATAIKLVTEQDVCPTLVVASYNLPGDLNGLQVVVKLREQFGYEIPFIILTDNIPAASFAGTSRQNCLQMTKPVKLKELAQAVRRLLSSFASDAYTTESTSDENLSAVIFIVDDDSDVRDAIRAVLEDDGRSVATFSSGEAFLAAYTPGREGCLLIDACLPGMSGLDLLERLRASGHELPAIMITGNGDVSMAVHAMKAGALDFIEKPIGLSELLANVNRALEQGRDLSRLSASRDIAADTVACLTTRERQIMDLVLAGHPSKNIAADLRISQRTVEKHRASIMEKTGSTSLPALARLALSAAWRDATAH